MFTHGHSSSLLTMAMSKPILRANTTPNSHSLACSALSFRLCNTQSHHFFIRFSFMINKNKNKKNTSAIQIAKVIVLPEGAGHKKPQGACFL